MKSFSQYNEDAIVASMLNGRKGTAVEIGAGDGVHLSNTALFRERGWLTILVESDLRYREALARLENVVVFFEPATPGNINQIVPLNTDFLSIDVDGDDIFLFEALEHQPEVVCIEYNPTMPWNVDVQPARLGLQIGASVPALMRVAEEKGYGLAAVTECNAIFRKGAEHTVKLNIPYPDYVVATEYFTGRPLVIGVPPWSVDFANPYPSEDVVVR